MRFPPPRSPPGSALAFSSSIMMKTVVWSRLTFPRSRTQPMNSRTVGASRSGDQHNLAEMGIGAHVSLRGGGLVERERAIDREVEFARLDCRPKIGAHLADDLANLLQ